MKTHRQRRNRNQTFDNIDRINRKYMSPTIDPNCLHKEEESEVIQEKTIVLEKKRKTKQGFIFNRSPLIKERLVIWLIVAIMFFTNVTVCFGDLDRQEPNFFGSAYSSDTQGDGPPKPTNMKKEQKKLQE
jgi:hypothetical protein